MRWREVPKVRAEEDVGGRPADDREAHDEASDEDFDPQSDPAYNPDDEGLKGIKGG